jgi:hypothetical protein
MHRRRAHLGGWRSSVDVMLDPGKTLASGDFRLA